MKIFSLKKTEKLITALIFGCLLPLLLCQIAFLIWFYLDRDESHVLLYVVSGFLSGVILDILFLKRWIEKRYEFPVWLLTGIYIFYNVQIFGMFMGFPIPAILIGMLAGYYWGNRFQYEDTPPDKLPEKVRLVSHFTGAVMTVDCLAAAYIALKGRGVGSEVQHMLGLGFEVTKPMLLLISIIGGIILVLLQIWLTKKTLLLFLKYHQT